MSLPTPHAKKRCWNCQDRKVACDKTLPACLKCQKRGTACRGYGLRLSWPSGDDPRRHSVRGDHFFLCNDDKNNIFVHASETDMHVLRGEPAYFDLPSSFSHMPPSLAAVDPSLQNGKSAVPALLASVTDAFDDLYGLLVRMALTPGDGDTSTNALSSLATRHALAALAYQSVGRGATAWRLRALATRQLQAAVDAGGSSLLLQSSVHPLQAMAASMLLNYCETVDDAHGSPLRSALFFCGCKRIALAVFQVHNRGKEYDGDVALLLDWILYQDTMYKFSIHHWRQRVPQQQMVVDGPKIVSKPLFSPLRHVVHAGMGCSLELLDVLCQVVDVVPYEVGEQQQQATEAEAARLRRLQLRLENIKQHVTGVEEADNAGGGDNSSVNTKKHRLETEARLYNIAALLYLHRLGRGVDKDDAAVQTLLDEAYALLRNLGHCSRPWVLFVVGVEARDEAERHTVMSCMVGQHSQQQQPPKNVALVLRLVQAAWTQIDLLSLDTAVKSISLVKVYNAVISANAFPPLFT